MDADPVRPAFHPRISGGARSSVTLPQQVDLRVALAARLGAVRCGNMMGVLGAPASVQSGFTNAEPIRGGPSQPALSTKVDRPALPDGRSRW